MSGQNPQEAQQAQTIERWSHSGYEEMTLYDDGVYVLYDDHKAIVDSQAQKIAEQGKRIGELEKAADVYVRKIESWGI